jgi:hypothetical protein
LINNPFFINKTVVFSFQRENRSYPGLTVIKKPDGKFLRNSDGTIFSISHLARSVSNLPGFITNGNTPQGIFSIQGIQKSNNLFIGPTPTLVLAMPNEIPTRDFFHSKIKTDSQWSKSEYAEMLPENWKNYPPIFEAYFAGAAGRNDIIAHGTTINPDFYENQPYYPNTVSLGCLTAIETWDPQNGNCIYSNQATLINAYKAINCQDSYLILININDKLLPITIDEILLTLLKAERIF